MRPNYTAIQEIGKIMVFHVFPSPHCIMTSFIYRRSQDVLVELVETKLT